MTSCDSGASLEKWLKDDPEGVTRACDEVLGRASLAEFFRAGWETLEPDTPLDDNWHVDAVCDHVQAVLEDWARAKAEAALEGRPRARKRRARAAFRQRIQNLLINIPPGTLKSRIVSVYTPAWAWLHWPSWRAIFLSANPRVALRDSLACRDLVTSKWYRDTFRPDWTLSKDQDAKGLFKNSRGGFRQAMGFNARITGDRADALFVDDPHDAEEVKSKAQREAVTERWKSAIGNRVNDLRRSVRIGIMQRLHESDWSGVVMKGGGWELLCLPLHFDPKRARTTAIGWSDPRKEAGENLFPARFPPEVIKAERERLGEGGFAGQYEQNPVPEGGAKFKSKWFSYWRPAGQLPPTSPEFDAEDPLPEDADPDLIRLLPHKGPERLVKLSTCRFFGSMDVAQSTKESADYTVFAVWAVTPDSDLILLHLERERLADPDIVPSMRRLYLRYKLEYWAVEQDGCGLGVVQTAQRDGMTVLAVLSSGCGDKFARASTAAIRLEAAQVYFPASAPWLGAFEHELTMFNNGDHDDQVDALSLAARNVFLMGGAAEDPEVTRARLEQLRQARHDEYQSPDNPALWAGDDDDD
jgi:predicted phage terminase large subunit-like protein